MTKEISLQEAERVAQKIITEANSLQQEHIWYKTNRMASNIRKRLDEGITEEELIYLLHNRLDYILDRGFSMHNFTFARIYNSDTLKYVKTLRHLISQSKFEEKD